MLHPQAKESPDSQQDSVPESPDQPSENDVQPAPDLVTSETTTPEPANSVPEVPTPDFGHGPSSPDASSQSSQDEYGTPPPAAQPSWFDRIFGAPQPGPSHAPPPVPEPEAQPQRRQSTRNKKRPDWLTYTKNFEQSTEQVALPMNEESTPESRGTDSDYQPPAE